MKPRCILIWSVLRYLGISVNAESSQSRPTKRSSNDYPIHNLVSSNAQAPVIEFLHWTPECNDGRSFFITPRGWKVSNPGPMILDEQGSLIWSERFTNDFGGQAYNLKVQKYRGEDYLTFWLGDDTVRGHGAGHYYMIGAANGLFADLHDFTITGDGTALLVIFQAVPADLRPVGRKFNDLWNQAVWDCIFQEIRIATGDLIFEWRASEHVNLTDSYVKLDAIGDAGTQANPYDWFHINSARKDYRGNYLISARNTHAIYYIDGKTKDIIWTLGGKNNSFQDLSQGNALNFAWQHDAQFIAGEFSTNLYVHSPDQSRLNGIDTEFVTLFDNAALDWDYSYGPPYSRGLVLEVNHQPRGYGNGNTPAALLDLRTPPGPFLELGDIDKEKVRSINGTDARYTVRVVKEYIHPLRLNSSTQGSMQHFPNGDVSYAKQVDDDDPFWILGYGINAVMTEFSSNGTLLCDVHFARNESWETGNVQSYRAYKHQWTGHPQTPPSAVRRGNVIYVSWNGATECREWLLEGCDDPSSDKWEDLIRVPKNGFETEIALDQVKDPSTYLRVAALDRNGRHLTYGVYACLYYGVSIDESLATGNPGLRVVYCRDNESIELTKCVNEIFLESKFG